MGKKPKKKHTKMANYKRGLLGCIDDFNLYVLNPNMPEDLKEECEKRYRDIVENVNWFLDTFDTNYIVKTQINKEHEIKYLNLRKIDYYRTEPNKWTGKEFKKGEQIDDERQNCKRNRKRV